MDPVDAAFNRTRFGWATFTSDATFDEGSGLETAGLSTRACAVGRALPGRVEETVAAERAARTRAAGRRACRYSGGALPPGKRANALDCSPDHRTRYHRERVPAETAAARDSGQVRLEQAQAVLGPLADQIAAVAAGLRTDLEQAVADTIEQARAAAHDGIGRVGAARALLFGELFDNAANFVALVRPAVFSPVLLGSPACGRGARSRCQGATGLPEESSTTLLGWFMRAVEYAGQVPARRGRAVRTIRAARTPPGGCAPEALPRSRAGRLGVPLRWGSPTQRAGEGSSAGARFRERQCPGSDLGRTGVLRSAASVCG
ncbi:hypothetical protein ABT158_46870 [Nonomuraea sp. NPDC001636]|uniref:hypothetical protein n=1 Tax=Nonomuraea sp. NPDC001636 TaxID=3154391 RepID=UPI00331BD1D8